MRHISYLVRHFLQAMTGRDCLAGNFLFANKNECGAHSFEEPTERLNEEGS